VSTNSRVPFEAAGGDDHAFAGAHADFTVTALGDDADHVTAVLDQVAGALLKVNGNLAVQNSFV
jgi:hypothetical protein